MYEAYCVYYVRYSQMFTRIYWFYLHIESACMVMGYLKKNISLLATSCFYEFLMIITIRSDYLLTYLLTYFMVQSPS